MGDGRIPNNHVTASRSWNGMDEGWRARINNNNNYHWAAGYNSQVGDYLQVYLGNATILTGTHVHLIDYITVSLRLSVVGKHLFHSLCIVSAVYSC